MVQGPNCENIEQLMRFKVVDNARDVLESFSSNEIAIKRGFTSVNDDKIFQFKANAVNILISLLEGQQNPKLANRIATSIEEKTLKVRMAHIYEKFLNKNNKQIRETDTENKEQEIEKKDTVLKKLKPIFSDKNTPV